MKSLTLGTFFKGSSVFPRISNWLDLLNLGALSVGMTNCQCSSEEENIKQKPSIYLQINRKSVFQPISISQNPIYQKIKVYIPLSIVRWDKDMFRQPESLSIDESNKLLPSKVYPMESSGD